jgi:uncharacterized protein (DUF2237 family)
VQPVAEDRLVPQRLLRDDAADVGSIPRAVTTEFLAFSKSRGNDLSTPRPEFGFPATKPAIAGAWCAARWQEAFVADGARRCTSRPRTDGCCRP